jgi:uncharacterized coiled-coil protein SlyX
MSLSHLSEENLGRRFKEIMRRIDVLEVKLTEQVKILEARNDRTIGQLDERINDKLDAVLELLNARQGTTVPDEQAQPEKARFPPSKKPARNAAAPGTGDSVSRARTG